MRVKIKNDGEYLKFGERYCISFYGCSFWWEILYTRKNTVIVEELVRRKIINNVPHMDVRRTFNISKRELKNILRDKEFVQWVCLIEIER